MAVEILYLLLFLALIVLSILDIKYREVPDWLNYGLIFAALGIRLIYSILHSDWLFFVYGVLGLAIFSGFSYLFYYLGQWGGGDAKTFMAIGAVIGINWKDISFPALFLLCSIFAGAFYGLIYSIIIAVRRKKLFVPAFKKMNSKFKLPKINAWTAMISFCLVLLFMVLDYLIFAVFVFGLSLFFIFSINLWIFIKTVEESCMMKLVDPKKLTEGDWLVDDIKIGNKKIVAKKNIGLEMKDIKKLIEMKKKHKLNKVLIKEGIPFEPAFLIGFVLVYFLKEWILMIFGL